MSNLEGRVLVIAGVGGGLGPVVAERLAAAGATVAGTDRHAETLEGIGAGLPDGERWDGSVVDLAVGVIIFVLWISPQAFFGQPARLIGFDPDVFSQQPRLYWLTVILRFARLVVVVPLVEEIFWRGFLLRYLVDEKFADVPFGKFTPFSFWAVSIAFALGHSMPDWIAAFVTGMAYNAVAYRTKSLTSCVFVHAITNLLLGLWIMRTHQWGFW